VDAACRAIGTFAGRPQRVVHVMPCGYSQHPGVAVRAKIIYLMHACGACVRP
jgi:hypothetical protein